MNSIIYRIIHSIVYVLTLTPFWVMYRLSDLIFFFLYYVFNYRKNIVLENLKNSFPEKSQEEINKISKDFYKYFVDFMLETFKTLTMSEKEAHRSFNEFPHHVIFRGHSHMPQILRPGGRRIESRSPAVGVKINLAGRLPCVVTCGALTRGLYMIWHPEENYIESLAFERENHNEVDIKAVHAKRQIFSK